MPHKYYLITPAIYHESFGPVVAGSPDGSVVLVYTDSILPVLAGYEITKQQANNYMNTWDNERML